MKKHYTRTLAMFVIAATILSLGVFAYALTPTDFDEDTSAATTKAPTETTDDSWYEIDGVWYDNLTWDIGTEPINPTELKASISAEIGQAFFDANADTDILIEHSLLRGNTWPTTIYSPLPYTASGTISEYTYTNYLFEPNSNGKLTTTFDGYVRNNEGSSSVTITLYKYYVTGPHQVIGTPCTYSGSSW
jgi:hypothetical protein